MDDELRRRADVEFAKYTTQFHDFLERYERDTKTNQFQMERLITTIESHDDFIRTIKPIYLRGMMVLGAALLGSVGLAVNWLWKHVSWGP